MVVAELTLQIYARLANKSNIFTGPSTLSTDAKAVEPTLLNLNDDGRTVDVTGRSAAHTSNVYLETEYTSSNTSRIYQTESRKTIRRIC